MAKREAPDAQEALNFYRLLPWIVWLSFLALYTITAAPSIVELFDDSLEFQLVLPTFGIAHPTGYPLYTLVGGLWTRYFLPFGSWAWRSNIFSAVIGATTVAMTFVMARRLTMVTGAVVANLAGLIAAALFGLGPVWWSQATVAEVYALHNLLLVTILLTGIGVERETGAAFGRRMALLFLLLGLGLSHHRTTVLVLPGLALYLVWCMPGIWRPRRAWWIWGTALLAPMLLYLYLPLRASMGVRDLHGSYQDTWTGFWTHVMASGYGSFLGGVSLAQEHTLGDWLALWVGQFGWLGMALSLLGLGWLFDRKGPAFKAWVMLALVLATNAIFAVLYQVADQEVFLIPAFLCGALLAGGGFALTGRRNWPQRTVLTLGISVILMVVLGIGRTGSIDRSADWQTHDYAVDMAKVAFPPGSRVIGLEGEVTALKYMQQAEGLGKEATAVVADEPGLRRTLLADTIADGLPAYITRELDGIEDAYSFSGEGPLVRVWPRGEVDAPAPQVPLALPIGGGAMTIEGYDLALLDWAGGDVARLVLYWRPSLPVTQTFKVSLRVVDAADEPLSYPDGELAAVDQYPLRAVSPSPAWLPGEVVRDVHEITLPSPALEDRARLLVVLYDADTLEEVGRLHVDLPLS